MVNLNLSPTSATFLTNLAQIKVATNRAQDQISSGFKVQQASDAPDQISSLLQFEADLQTNKQITTNLNGVKTVVDVSEGALNSAVQLAQNAISLGAQGAGGTQTALTRQNLSQQVESVLNQLVGLTNTTVQGRFVFSGDSSRSPTYQVDLTSPNGVDRLAITAATLLVQDTNGASFPIARTSQDIFDHRNSDDTFAPDNLFVAVNNLRVALANNDTPGISAALDSLHKASDYVNCQQVFYGVAQDRVASATADAHTQSLSLTSQIAAIREADYTQAAIELTEGQTQQSAAYSAQAKLPKTSLFDFLG